MFTPPPVPRVIFCQICWVIWFALLSGVLMIRIFAAPAVQNSPIPGADASPLWLIALLPLAISALVRWLVLPKTTTVQAALPVFIIGMALAEATALAGMFIFPTHREELVVLGILGIVQFMPLFAGRFGKDR